MLGSCVCTVSSVCHRTQFHSREYNYSQSLHLFVCLFARFFVCFCSIYPLEIVREKNNGYLE